MYGIKAYEIKGFCPKSCYHGPFCERNAITRVDLQNGAVPGFPCVRMMIRLFLVFTYFWMENVAKIFKVPGAPLNIKPDRAITWLVGLTNYYTLFQPQFTYTLPAFKRQYSIEKKLAWGNAH